MIGLGALGCPTLEILSRTPTITESLDKIIAADVRENKGTRKMNTALMTAEQLGYHPDLEFMKINLFDIEKTTEQLKSIDPDLIYAAVSLLTWWIPRYLPKKQADRITQAGIGSFLPMHLTLLYNLMRAIRKAGIDPLVVNASIPDITAPTLKKAGLPYTVGIGNIGIVIPLLKWTVSKKLGIPMRDITVSMVAPHFVAYALTRVGTTEGAPYFLKIIVNSKDVTSKIDPDKSLARRNPGLPKLLGGIEINSLVAACSVSVIRGLIQNTQEIIHAPGPNGLPGGYPIRVGRKGVEVVLPEELTLEEAVLINEEAQKFDGIEEIKDDGTVVFTEKSRNIMKEELGYDCRPFKPHESEKRARELGACFKAFGKKWGLPDFALKAIWSG